jgi:transposase InsO family protein
MTTRKSYHSTIKLAFALDIHKNWLPKEFLETIPRSTTHGWKNETHDKFVGYELANGIGENIDELKLLYDHKVSKEKQLFITYTKIKLTLIHIIGKDTIRDAFRDNFRMVVKLIESTQVSFGGGVKTLCSFLDIKTHTFRYWKNVSKFKCNVSPLGLCVKKVPNQATQAEISTMKRLLNRKRFEHWPICSVWGYAIRKGDVSLSLNSWYRYNQKFEFRKKNKKGRYKKVYYPITAPRPNHTWHADITVVTTLDGVKHYVYLIVDNYSKHILNSKVDSKCNGKIRTQTIKEAVYQEFGDDINQTSSIDLIVDGGTENNNKTVEQFIKDAQVDITKKIALKDIVQSNSMVEASNKIIKHRYLFRKPIYNREHLELHLQEAIHDYCHIRPHYSLGIYTPFEVHTNTRPKISPNYILNAVKERRIANKSLSCDLKC